MKGKFLSSNDTKYRLGRTILQGIIGVVIANLDMLISGVPMIPPQYKPMIAALVMAILSPIMSELGKDDDCDDTIDYLENPEVDEEEEFGEDGEE